MDAFGIAFIVLALVAVVAAAVSYWGSGSEYSRIGGGELAMDHTLRDDPDPGSSATREDIRQMLEAKSERRVARGGAPLDVEAETERLLRELEGDSCGSPGIGWP